MCIYINLYIDTELVDFNMYVCMYVCMYQELRMYTYVCMHMYVWQALGQRAHVPEESAGLGDNAQE